MCFFSFQEIDEMIDQASKQGYTTLVTLGTKGLQTLMKTAIIVSYLDSSHRDFCNEKKQLICLRFVVTVIVIIILERECWVFSSKGPVVSLKCNWADWKSFYIYKRQTLRCENSLSSHTSFIVHYFIIPMLISNLVDSNTGKKYILV